MGTGNFFGMLPEKMRGSRLYGVELDNITGRIAKQLYPGADIKITGFEKTAYPNDFFDIAIGSVPFGHYQVPDKKYDKLSFPVHEYFLPKRWTRYAPAVSSRLSLFEKQLKEAVSHISGSISMMEFIGMEDAAAGIPADPDVKITATRLWTAAYITVKTLS